MFQLRVTMPSWVRANACSVCFEPELDSNHLKRSQWTMQVCTHSNSSADVIFKVHARDVNALRASIHSITESMQLVDDVFTKLK